MGLREWINGMRRREDASAVRRAEAMSTETERERAASSGDVESIAADEAARERGGEPPTEDFGHRPS